MAAFACLRAAEGKLKQAAQLCGSVEGFLASVSASLFHWDEAFFNLNVSKLREELPEAVFSRAWQSGYKMTLDAAVECALRKA